MGPDHPRHPEISIPRTQIRVAFWITLFSFEIRLYLSFAPHHIIPLFITDSLPLSRPAAYLLFSFFLSFFLFFGAPLAEKVELRPSHIAGHNLVINSTRRFLVRTQNNDGNSQHDARAVMSEQVDMTISPVRAKALTQAIQSVSERINTVSKGRNVRHDSSSST